MGLLTNEQFLQKLKDKGREDIEPLEEYKGSTVRIRCRCKKHNVIFETMPNSLYEGAKCPECRKESLFKSNGITPEEFMKRFKEKGNPNVIVIGDYYRWDKPIKCKCKNKGHIWDSTPMGLLSGNGCPYCANRIGTEENCFATHYPELIRYFKNKEEAYKYSCGSGKEVELVCPDCGAERKMKLCDLKKRGFICQVCSDGISFPNKILRNFLLDDSVQKQLDSFEFEWDPKWEEKCRFDGYFQIKGKQFVVEMQGAQHYKKRKNSNWDFEKQQKKDEYKRNQTKKLGITEIEINCSESDFNYIKSNIENSLLFKILDLSNVNWDKIQRNCYNNLVKKCCDLYKNNKYCGVGDIAKILKIDKSVATSYLKKGTELGWCDYSKDRCSERNRVRYSKWIYEIYYKMEKVTEVFGTGMAYEFIKEHYPDCVIAFTTIIDLSKTEKELRHIMIKRKENPYKANKTKEIV